jgi:endonuclease G, mitochondrial
MKQALTPYQSLQLDRAVYEELLDTIDSRKKHQIDQHIEIANEIPFAGRKLGLNRKAIMRFMTTESLTDSRIDSPDRLPEAIVLFQGRPAFLIQNGKVQITGSDEWNRRLIPHQSHLSSKVIPAVGRVELFNHPDFTWVGTAWMIDEKIMVTNRHVAQVFAKKQGLGFVFITNHSGVKVEANIDFREEYQIPAVNEVSISDVLFIANDGGPDLAFLKLKNAPAGIDHLELADADVKNRDPIAVIGYPALDTRNDGLIMSRIFADIFDVKRFAPGQVSLVDGSQQIFQHDCSTLGGNSGSPVINYETGKVVGLHFSGRFGVSNFAVKASLIKQYLMQFSPVSASVGIPEERRTPADYADRTGYNEKFLGNRQIVSMPQLSSEQEDDAVVVNSRSRGIAKYSLDYTHFSLVICKSRKTVYFTAVNIDGNQEVIIRRKNTAWLLDPRIAIDEQIGNDFYASNRIDRGHMVRRNDPVWGSDDEAKQAENDTFHFTNAAPQHADLNQKEWLKLEDYLLQNANSKDLKISVFTGPVFSETDIEYRGERIPEQFWKVVAMIGPEGNLHATAYLLSQRQFLDDLEFVFGKFRTYQTSVQHIEELTGLSFGKLKECDPLNNSEGLSSDKIVRPIIGLESIIF